MIGRGLISDWAAAKAIGDHMLGKTSALLNRRIGFGNFLSSAWKGTADFFTAADFNRTSSLVLPPSVAQQAQQARGWAIGRRAAMGLGGAYLGLDLTRRAFTDPNSGRFNIPGMPFF